VWIFSRAQARERDAEVTAKAGDLHGVAKVELPRGFQSLGLGSADRTLSPEEQLARHDESTPLVFGFTRDPSNDWGGHKRDPELLNIVFFPPSWRDDVDRALRHFSIGRYYSPTDSTIPLDSPQWLESRDERYRWRMLAMNDHFTSNHPPRWAVTMLDPTRGIRVDYFVLQRRADQAEALALVRGVLDKITLLPALTEFFTQTGGVDARLQRLREANTEGVFSALAPYELAAPKPGETTFGRGVAAWLDDDRRAIRVMRVLASIPIPGGSAKANVDRYGRPLLPLVLKPNQYPGPTQDGLPSLNLQMLYWNPSLARWQRSELQRATIDENEPLLPFESVVVTRLEREANARDAVHIILGAHYFHPPALDDARRIGELLEECEYWQKELLAGRIVSGEVRASMLR
jgi:hypothetical protein